MAIPPTENGSQLPVTTIKRIDNGHSVGADFGIEAVDILFDEVQLVRRHVAVLEQVLRLGKEVQTQVEVE